MTTSTDAFFEALRFFFNSFIEWTGVGTYSLFHATYADGRHNLQLTPFFAPNYTEESFNELIKSFFDKLEELELPSDPRTEFHEVFYSAYGATWGYNVPLNTVGGGFPPRKPTLPPLQL